MHSASYGALDIGAGPKVVGTASNLDTLRSLAEGAPPEIHADIVEVRLDLMGWKADDWPGLCARLNERVPVLFTLRRAEEGGNWEGPEQERLSVYQQALPCVAGVDIELRSAIRGEVHRDAVASGRSVIVSYHDFERTPTSFELTDVVNQMAQCEGATGKIAAMLNDDEDEVRLRGLLSTNSPVPLCVLGMGRWVNPPARSTPVLVPV